MSGALDGLRRVFLGDRIFRPRGGAQGQGAAGAQDEAAVPEQSGLRFTVKFLVRDRAALAGLAIIGLFLGWGLVEGVMQYMASYTHVASWGWRLLPSDPISLNFRNSLASPSLSNLNDLFGANYEGQSVLSQLLYATPHDATASVLVVASAIAIGMTIGIPAGYIGGWTDEVLMRVTDAFLAFPYLVLAIAFSVLLGGGFTTVLLALVVIWWPTYARYFRAQAISLKGRNFVEASKLSGVGPLKIMFRHIFPNSIDPVIAQATLDFGSVILLYSTLAFLGIGLQLDYPEWGSMSSLGISYFPASWWLVLVPGVTIMVIVVAFSLIGDRLQDLVAGRFTY